MYTVIRFIANSECLGRLLDVGTAMNAIRKGVYAGLRKAGDGFCCEICAGRDWGEHQREILRFITEFGHSINTAIQGGAVVTVDVAVEPEDRESAGSILVLRCERDVMAALSSCGAELELSIY